MIIVHNRKSKEFDDPKKLYDYLSTLENETVEIRNPPVYRISSLFINDDGLQFLQKTIDDCITCTKEQCDCSKPYFLIKNYLQAACKDYETCDQKCDNPLKCKFFVNELKTTKKGEIIKLEGVALDKIFKIVYTALNKISDDITESFNEYFLS